MKPYAIIQASGKQFWVEEDRFYDFNKLPLNQGDSFCLNKVLLVNKHNSVSIGKPFLQTEYVIKASVLRHLSGVKTRVYKMRPKKKTRKTFGSRPKLTRIVINSITKPVGAVLAIKVREYESARSWITSTPSSFGDCTLQF